MTVTPEDLIIVEEELLIHRSGYEWILVYTMISEILGKREAN